MLYELIKPNYVIHPVKCSKKYSSLSMVYIDSYSRFAAQSTADTQLSVCVSVVKFCSILTPHREQTTVQLPIGISRHACSPAKPPQAIAKVYDHKSKEQPGIQLVVRVHFTARRYAQSGLCCQLVSVRSSVCPSAHPSRSQTASDKLIPHSSQKPHAILPINSNSNLQVIY